MTSNTKIFTTLLSVYALLLAWTYYDWEMPHWKVGQCFIEVDTFERSPATFKILAIGDKHYLILSLRTGKKYPSHFQHVYKGHQIVDCP